MEKVLKADDVKPNFEGLKIRWQEMLTKYYLGSNTLDPQCTREVFCPFCNSMNASPLFNLNGFWHNRCLECETLYVSPRLSDECIEGLYSDAYYSEMYTRSMLPVFDKRKEYIGRRKYTQAVGHWNKKECGRVLDVGAGIGEVIDVFREQGWGTHAIEMNPVAVDWLNSRELTEVFHGTLEAYESDQSFDIIMAWGVVEHVLDPDAFLKKVCALLAPGGLFVSEVPHGSSLLVDMTRKTGVDPKRILMGEQHIVLYSTNAYVELHQRNGLSKVHLQTNGLDCDTLFKEYGVEVPDEMLSSMQECIDDNMYGDLLRGFWRRD